MEVTGLTWFRDQIQVQSEDHVRIKHLYKYFDTKEIQSRMESNLEKKKKKTK